MCAPRARCVWIASATWNGANDLADRRSGLATLKFHRRGVGDFERQWGYDPMNEIPVPDRKGFWPNEMQGLLLRVILADGDDRTAARQSWAMWKDATPKIDGTLDLASLRLLPLVYKALAARGDDDPTLPKLAEIYRKSWMNNQILLAELAVALRILAGAGVDSLVLKGAALGELHYRDRGARPMGDVDVAVRRDSRERAIDSLVRSGWQLAAPEALAFDAAFRHGCALRSPQGVELDLHWHIFSDCCRDSVDAPLWQRSIAFEINGTTSRALDPTDALLHAVVHGTRWNPVSPVRWLTDAGAILRTSNTRLDWDRLRRQASDAGFALRVGAALAYLHRNFGLGIPPEAVSAIAATPVTTIERLEYRCIGDSDSWSGVNLSSLVLAYSHCARATHGRSTPQRLAYFGRYLRSRLRGKHVLRRFAADPAAALRVPGPAPGEE